MQEGDIVIVDVHMHYGYQFFPVDVPGEDELICAMDRFGIDIGIVSSFRGIFYDFRNCNEELASAISRYPDRLKGYIVLNPNYIDESLRQLDYFSATGLFCGVKLHASWHNKAIDGPEFEVLINKTESKGLPVLVHSYVVDDYADQVSSPERVANMARRHPSVRVILAHMGGNARRAVRAVKNVKNIYLDISCGRENASQLYVWEMGRIDDAVAVLGADRILFGTDIPLIDPSICLGMIQDAEITADEKDMIMWKNACRIFGIEYA
jgi:uncharacterized protein